MEIFVEMRAFHKVMMREFQEILTKSLTASFAYLRNQKTKASDKIKADAFLPVVHVIFKVDVHSLRSLMSFKIAELAFDYNRQSRPPFTIGHILPTQMFSAIVSI